MLPRSRWPLAAFALSLSLSLGLVLVMPTSARASACDLLNQLGACTPSESGLDFNPDGTITLPGSPGSSGPSRPPAPSRPTLRPDAARQLLDLANQERARVGAPTLVTRDDVVRMAIAHTRKMLGSDGGIFHNLDLLTKPLRNTLGALAVGENVGYSTHLEDLHPRFMASPGHRAALLDPRFTVAGFAVIQDTDGLYYVTQDFVQPSGAAAAPAPVAPPAPAPPAPPSPAGDDAQARPAAPVEPVTQEAAADSARQPPDVSAEPVVETPTTLGTVVRQGDASEFAQGEVAGLISVLPVSAPSSSGLPVALAVVLLAAALLGQGSWWARARRMR